MVMTRDRYSRRVVQGKVVPYEKETEEYLTHMAVIKAQEDNSFNPEDYYDNDHKEVDKGDDCDNDDMAKPGSSQDHLGEPDCCQVEPGTMQVDIKVIKAAMKQIKPTRHFKCSILPTAWTDRTPPDYDDNNVMDDNTVMDDNDEKALGGGVPGAMSGSLGGPMEDSQLPE
jgi:hypothetical protein